MGRPGDRTRTASTRVTQYARNRESGIRNQGWAPFNRSVFATRLSRRPMAKSSRAAKVPAAPVSATPGFSTQLSGGRAFLLNLAFVAGLLVLSQLPLLQPRPVVRASIVGAALVLLAWSALLFGVLRRGQKVTLDVVLRRQHYLQACQQGALHPLLGLLLARGLSRGAADPRAAPVCLRLRQPVVVDAPAHVSFSASARSPSFSASRCSSGSRTTWFYWQFAMVAIGWLAKEFLRWKRDGVNTHIFNPSSFPLAVVSVRAAARRRERDDLGLRRGADRSSIRRRCISRSFLSRCRGSICSASRR